MKLLRNPPSYIHFNGGSGRSFSIVHGREEFPPVDFSTYDVTRKALLKEIARTTRLEEELKALKEKYNE